MTIQFFNSVDMPVLGNSKPSVKIGDKNSVAEPRSTTQEPPVKKSDDFVDRAVQIVKAHCQSDTLTQISSDLETLGKTLSTPAMSPEQFTQIVQQLKAEQATNIPVVYSQLISGLAMALAAKQTSLMQYQMSSIENFNQFDEEFRIECAKIDLKSSEQLFCQNFRSYSITDLETRKKFVKEVKDGETIAETIGNFDLDVETRKEMAGNVLKYSGYNLAKNFRNFAFADEHDRSEFLNRVIENGFTGAATNFIGNFQLSERHLMEAAKKLASISPGYLCEDIGTFGISNEAALAEIAGIALKKDPDSIRFFSHFGIMKFSNLLKLFSSVSCSTASEGFFQKIFGTIENTRKMTADLPELSYWMLRNSPEDMLVWVSEFYTFLKPAIYDVFTDLFNEIQQEKGSLTKTEKIQHFLLYSTALTIYSKSEELGEALTKIIEKLKSETNPRVRNEKRDWLASFLLQCRTKGVSAELIFKQMPIVEALLELRDPPLRLRLLENLMAFLTDFSFVTNYDECQKKLSISKKQQVLSIPLMLLAAYLSPKEIARVAELLKNKNFEDKSRMKSLLSKLEVLIKETRLTREEKIKILEQVIFVNDKKMIVKAQAEQIITSAELVVQFLEFGEIELLKSVKDPRELRAHVKDMFISKLQLGEVENFDQLYAGTFLKARKANAILTYAAKMQSIRKEDRAEVFKLIRAFAINVLNNQFYEERYSINSSAHLKKLNEVAPKTLALFKEKFTHDGVMLTDDPWDLLLSGKETDTCQSYDGADDYSRCLIATVMKGETKQFVIKNEDGIILGKSTIRLLLDDMDKPVLFVGDVYPWGGPSGYTTKIEAAQKAFADKLGIPVLRQVGATPYPRTLICLPGADVQFEYVEGADITTRPPSIVQGKQGYTVSKAALVYSPKPTPTIQQLFNS